MEQDTYYATLVQVIPVMIALGVVEIRYFWPRTVDLLKDEKRPALRRLYSGVLWYLRVLGVGLFLLTLYFSACLYALRNGWTLPYLLDAFFITLLATFAGLGVASTVATVVGGGGPSDKQRRH